MVHSQSSAYQTKDHEGELTRHEAGCGNRENGGSLGSQFRKENVLCTLNNSTVDHGSSAHGSLPEGHIEDMMQTEGDQSTLGDTVDPGTDISGVDNQIAQQCNTLLNNGPQIEHGNTNHQINSSGHNGNKTGAAEEAQNSGQLNLIELVMQSSNAQTDDNTAEHAHLQSGNAQSRGGRVSCHGFHASVGIDHGTDGSVHNQIANGTGQSSNFLFFLCHADGNTHGKQQSQISKNCVTTLVHDVQDGMQNGTGIDYGSQAIGFQHGGIGERRTYTQQKTCNRQQCDGQHKGAANTLQNAKNFIFHCDPPEKSFCRDIYKNPYQGRNMHLTSLIWV